MNEQKPHFNPNYRSAKRIKFTFCSVLLIFSEGFVIQLFVLKVKRIIVLILILHYLFKQWKKRGWNKVTSMICKLTPST